LNGPAGVAVDSTGLYVADQNNNRVIFYPAGSTVAARVYGQPNMFSTGGGSSRSANSLLGPVGVAVDANCGLYVADAGKNRVVYYLSGSTTASVVIGQCGVFSSGSPNPIGITGDSLSAPQFISADSRGGIFIAESNNNRTRPASRLPPLLRPQLSSPGAPQLPGEARQRRLLREPPRRPTPLLLLH
jgi:hypothetical protein